MAKRKKADNGNGSTGNLGFEQKILSATGGRGVNVVLSNVADEYVKSDGNVARITPLYRNGTPLQHISEMTNKEKTHEDDL